VFKTFFKVNARWAFSKNQKGEKLIPEKCYQVRKCSQTLAAIIAKAYPGCFWYMGGVIPVATFPASSGDLKTTLENVGKAGELIGSDKAATSILAQMKGYSALTDDMGRRVQWILGTVLGLWSSGKNVAIKYSTTGDIPIIASSLQKWKRKITEKKPDLFCTMQNVGTSSATPVVEPRLNDMEFCFVLTEGRDHFKIHNAYVALCQHQVPKDAVVVYYNEQSLPSSQSKGVKPDFDYLSTFLVGEDVRGVQEREHDYVVYTIVYGAVPFSQDQAVQRVLDATTMKLKFWKREPHVYAWGSSAKFHAVITNMPSYQLIGWGIPPTVDKPVEREDQCVFVPLRPSLMKTQAEWYKKVVGDARVRCFSFLNPISRYSPISNLPFLSKVGLTYTLTKVESESGDLIGNIIRVNRDEGQTEFVPTFEMLASSSAASVPNVPRVLSGPRGPQPQMPLVPMGPQPQVPLVPQFPGVVLPQPPGQVMAPKMGVDSQQFMTQAEYNNMMVEEDPEGVEFVNFKEGEF